MTTWSLKTHKWFKQEYIHHILISMWHSHYHLCVSRNGQISTKFCCWTVDEWKIPQIQIWIRILCIKIHAAIKNCWALMEVWAPPSFFFLCLFVWKCDWFTIETRPPHFQLWSSWETSRKSWTLVCRPHISDCTDFEPSTPPLTPHSSLFSPPPSAPSFHSRASRKEEKLKQSAGVDLAKTNIYCHINEGKRLSLPPRCFHPLPPFFWPRFFTFLDLCACRSASIHGKRHRW